MYKDKDKQRKTDRDRQRRYRATKGVTRRDGRKGVTNEGVTGSVVAERKAISVRVLPPIRSIQVFKQQSTNPMKVGYVPPVEQ